jgi:hypothetical protein
MALAITVCLQGCGTTVLTAACDKPSVSNRSVPLVYLVMLPYVYRGSSSPSEMHRSAIDSLNDVARLQVVRMGAEASEMHVTLLQDSGKGCEIEGVRKAFSESLPLKEKLLSTVVFYWGEVFEVEDRIIVQSHVRVLWKNPTDDVVWFETRLPKSDARVRFSGVIPYSTVSFPPGNLPVGDEVGGSGLRMLLEARKEPGLAAEAVPLPRSFLINQRVGNWVELRDPKTWVPSWVAVTDPGSNAKLLLPELSFAQALAAYASYSAVPNDLVAANSIRWLNEFRSAYPATKTDAQRQSMAIADLIEAVLRQARDNGEADQLRASELMDRAVDALPTNSAALNLAAISMIERCCGTWQEAIKIQRRLELARQLDVGNEVIAKNLLNWYQLLEQKEADVPSQDREAMRRRMEGLTDALR